MKRIKLIVAREYWSRVSKKSFILGTFLMPVGIGLYFFAIGFISSYEGEEEKRIIIIDKNNVLNLSKEPFKDENGILFSLSNETPQALASKVETAEFDAVLEIPPLDSLESESLNVQFYTAEDKPLSPILVSRLKEKIGERLRSYKIAALGLDDNQLKSIETTIRLDTRSLLGEKRDGNVALTSAIAAGIGMFMGLMMYSIVFLYGMMVMRSVMEEKTNRIVEVMISSVKPFELMLGKIISVSLVGLTQVAIWAIMIPIVYAAVQLFWGIDTTQMQAVNSNMANSGLQQPQIAESLLLETLKEIGKQNWLLIIPLFLIYFLGGYFLYASMFAAVGSAIGDDTGEAQSLTLPISLPIIIAMGIMFTVIRNPYSKLATFASIFPLFSPVVMPARLAFSPPWWEIVLSVVLLIANAIFFVWLSSRIYRIGILLYGKKITFKEMGKWLFQKI